MGRSAVWGILTVLFLVACGGGGGDTSPVLLPPSEVVARGTVSAALHAAVDSDTNDPLSRRINNSALDRAQPLVAPVVLGGFVTRQPTGQPGDPFEMEADPDDFFQIELAAGQTITLETAEPPETADLDLLLFDEKGALVDSSEGTGRFESVTVPAAGTYFVLVTATQGASTYILSVGSGALTLEALRLSSEFVPGEAVVRFRPDTLPESATAGARAFGLDVKAGDPGRSMLLTFADSAQTFSALGVSSSPPLPPGTSMTTKQAAKRDTLRTIKALRARGEIAAADPNFIHHSLAVPNDPHYPLQWHYPLINLPQAWDVTTGTPPSGEVVVAVADTGVFLAHADLAGQFVGGYDFIRNPLLSGDGDGLDPDPNDPGDGTTPAGHSWHGTHVAGTIAARTNNDTGVAGVSWGAKIMPIRVLGLQGRGTSYDIIQGARYAAGLENDSGMLPPQRADILNLSLGCSNCYSAQDEEAYAAIRNAGVLIVAAAGNEGSSAPSYPASYAGVVSVGAVDMNRTRTSYSNHGPQLDLVAPGGDISQDLNGDGHGDGVLSTLADQTGTASSYGFLPGTSMAAPHVAGVAALMKAVHPDLSPDDFDALLAAGKLTSDLGMPGRDDFYGHGLIDAARAVGEARRLAGGAEDYAFLTLTPNRLDFSVQSQAFLTATRLGTGNLAVTRVTVDAPWLSVASSAVDDNGFGTYVVTVDRSSLEPGSYSTTITFETSQSSDVTVPVSLRIGAPRTSGDLGTLWFLLLDQEFNPVAQTYANGSDGRYAFRFNGVRPGTYYLYAGTDLDNDGFICDAGEACGAYPTLSSPAPLHLNADRSGVDFGAGFEITLPTSAGEWPTVKEGLRKLQGPSKEIGED